MKTKRSEREVEVLHRRVRRSVSLLYGVLDAMVAFLNESAPAAVRRRTPARKLKRVA